MPNKWILWPTKSTSAKLLDDVKAYLKSNPKQLDWQRMNISEIGYRLIQENQSQYIGREVARWNLELQPRENHFDRRITVTTPLQKAGAYMLTANVGGGNTSKIVLWLSDTAIVRKPLPDKSFYFVADAVSGAPIANANVEFFAFRQRHVDGNNYQVDTKAAAGVTDANGQVLLPIPGDNDPSQREFQWLVTATTAGGRLAYLGFHNVWRVPYHEAAVQRRKDVCNHGSPRLSTRSDRRIQVLDSPGPVRHGGQIAVCARSVRRGNPQSQRRKSL